jgi:hypothetical protein
MTALSLEFAERFMSMKSAVDNRRDREVSLDWAALITEGIKNTADS